MRRNSILLATIGYLFFLAFCSACFYVFLLGMAGEFGDHYETLRSYQARVQIGGR